MFSLQKQKKQKITSEDNQSENSYENHLKINLERIPLNQANNQPKNVVLENEIRNLSFEERITKAENICSRILSESLKKKVLDLQKLVK